MSTEGDNDPDERLRRELARLPRELVPPKGLEARVVAALRERGWLAAARPRPNPWRLGGAGAARAAAPLRGFLGGSAGPLRPAWRCFSAVSGWAGRGATVAIRRPCRAIC